MRAGVYAEPLVVERAARELEDLDKIIRAAETLYGIYRWERYDVLFLPPSFPYGGMENPRLTFASTTMLPGDKSMIGLISHELAHSWSGNMVTNATWRDFWLNEGFTTYFERRIQEAVYGRERSEMEAYLERAELEREMATLEDRDEILYIDLNGRDPDEGSTSVPYMKGMLLLRKMEETFGRERFDPFLRGYFEAHSFQSITTGDFVAYVQKHLFERSPEPGATIDLDEWLTKPGLPASAPQPRSDAFDRAGALARSWLEGKTAASAVPWKRWSMHERMHFLTSLPADLPANRMAELDSAFDVTSAANAGIASQWLLMAVRSGYKAAYGRLERFLTEVGRRKYIVPIYTELAKTSEGKQLALEIYRRAGPGYHPISAATIEQVLGGK
jgi:aminopeptidase N